MAKARTHKIPVPPYPMPLEPKTPGTLRRTLWAEGGRIMCWQEVADHEGVLSVVDRFDEDFSISGEMVSSMRYVWGPDRRSDGSRRV